MLSIMKRFLTKSKLKYRVIAQNPYDSFERLNQRLDYLKQKLVKIPKDEEKSKIKDYYTFWYYKCLYYSDYVNSLKLSMNQLILWMVSLPFYFLGTCRILFCIFYVFQGPTKAFMQLKRLWRKILKDKKQKKPE